MKKNYFVYSALFYIVSVIFIMTYSASPCGGASLEYEVLAHTDVGLSLSLSWGNYVIIFMMTVFSVFSSVYHYSMYYMEGDTSLKRFFITLVLFVLSMLMLICGGNLFTSIIGWDGLGITSMLLIMHYCSNTSLKASMYTFVINRLGDCFFLIFIFLMFCKYPSLNFFMQSFISEMDYSMPLAGLLILLSITKSAQVPFSSWLTKAMEAPTPVSSLVHSSTLVTAGIYMLFLYRDLWKSSDFFGFVLISISLSTIIVASIAGLVEVDLKKIVAYSTLSQLGFILLSFSLSLFQQGFFHLIIHAFFKALMFMGSGYIIHNSSGWQDVRLMSLNLSCSPNVMKIFLLAVISLCGAPFLSGFYSKDYVLDSLMKFNYPLLIFFLLVVSFILTLKYSFRICWYLAQGMKKISMVNDDCPKMISSMYFLAFMTCCTGSSMSWSLFPYSSGLSVDSPKIMLVSILLVVLVYFWTFPSVVKKNIYLKTNMYLYLTINLLKKNVLALIQTSTWGIDLLGVMGNFFTKPGLLTKKWYIKNDMISESFKEFLIFSFVLIMIYGITQ